MLCIVKGVILFRSDRPFSLLLLQLVSASFARPREKNKTARTSWNSAIETILYRNDDSRLSSCVLVDGNEQVE